MHALPPRKFVPMTHSDFSDRAKTYAQLKHSIVGLICDRDPIANQANFSAAIFAATGWHWVGFYRVEGDELVLGPFQGPVACTRLHRDQGVCSAAWRTAKSVLVPDVETFPGHIACSAMSRSEIAIPLVDARGRVQAVFDIDSVEIDDFSAEDARELEALLNEVCDALLPSHS